ncbi:MAG TPA: HAMP domain-containing sensor histidine kinase, partial [Candidatus Baltobacteraceae bacterium]|nr:HAMP domain-containing sensor histidine kinase [Candidatus Baltobacteraceae bacterium]
MSTHSLQLRIVAAIALVCAATIAAVAAYVGRTTLLVRIGPPSERVAAEVATALAPSLRTRHARATLPRQLARFDAAYDARIILASLAAHQAFSSLGPVAASDFRIDPDGAIELDLQTPGTSLRNVMMLRGGTVILDGNAPTAWRLFVLPASSPADAFGSARGLILRSIWQSAALAFAAALAVALLLGFSIVKPIRELTAAARAMGKGDTTRRVKVAAGDEIGQLGGAFNAMAEAIETTERLRRRMITDVAHELRIPLTRMIVQLEAAGDGHLSNEEALAGALDEARRLKRVANDLRDLSLADAHELSIASREIEIEHCIHDAIARAQHGADEAGVTIVRDIDPHLPVAFGDELRVAQILDNLIANAMHYTPAGGCVIVGARANPTHVECFVQDNGAGIAPEQQKLIFERFYRADPSRSRATGGSGLGLAIVKSLVEALGGSIAVESTLGAGS